MLASAPALSSSPVLGTVSKLTDDIWSVALHTGYRTMPIVSFEVASLSPSGDRVYVTYRFTDHVGGIHDVNRLSPSTTDHDQVMLDLIPYVDVQIIEEEVGGVVGRVESGENPVSVVDGAVHSTTKRLSKKLIFWMMRERDPYIVILLEPLILDIRATYTAGQIATFLDITVAQVTRLNVRINRILDNKADFVAFRDEVEDFGGV